MQRDSLLFVGDNEPGMLLLYGDETNTEMKAGEFFIYAAVIMGAEDAKSVLEAVATTRKELKVPADHVMKFNPGPKGFAHSDFIKFKSTLLKRCSEAGARVMAVATHHKIISNPDIAEARRFAINQILYRFNGFCGKTGRVGMAVFDRFDHDKAHREFLEEKMSKGITTNGGKTWAPLRHLVGCHMSSVYQSPFCQLTDVVVGTLRAAIGIRLETEKGRPESATAMFELLQDYFPSDEGVVPEPFFVFSPQTVKVPDYRARYRELARVLAEDGIRLTGVERYDD